MADNTEFIPKLDFLREGHITALESSNTWRSAVKEAVRDAGVCLSARSRLWLGHARPLHVPVVGWREFQAFHASLDLPYSADEMTWLGDYIDDKLPESADAGMVMGAELRIAHQQGENRRQSRLYVQLGQSVLQEKQLIRQITEDFYGVRGTPGEAWGDGREDTKDVLIACTSYGEAARTIEAVRESLEADPQLLLGQIALSPLLYEDNLPS